MRKRLLLRITTIILGICLALTAIFGFALTMPMTAGVGMSWLYCPAMSVPDVFCPMNVLEHLASWNNLFSALPVLLLVLGTLLGVCAFRRVTNEHTGGQRYKRRYYGAREYIRKLFDNLLVALRRGRVQPRLYNAVIS